MTRLRALALCALLPAAVPVGAAEAVPNLTVDLGFVFEPIVITAPRVKLSPGRVIDPRINSLLLRLLVHKSEVRPDGAAGGAAAAGVLTGLTTLSGHLLSQRYTQLGFLLTEGLAGSQDPAIQRELEAISRSSVNPQMRAAAMVALAYVKDERYVPLFQQGLQDPLLSVRLGALEALMISGSPAAEFSFADVSGNDVSPTMKVMAAAAYWRKGNPRGRDVLLALARDDDWYVRAYAIHNIGALGGGDEYRKLFDMLGNEQDPIVQSELTLAVIRLERFQ